MSNLEITEPDNMMHRAVPITLLPNAISHVQAMLAKQKTAKGLRLGVKTTGCSGLAYVVELVAAPDPEDIVYPQEKGILVFVSPKSLPFLKGVQVDYVRQGLNKSFHFTNPNETASCGCGESFTVMPVS